MRRRFSVSDNLQHDQSARVLRHLHALRAEQFLNHPCRRRLYPVAHDKHCGSHNDAPAATKFEASNHDLSGSPPAECGCHAASDKLHREPGIGICPTAVA
jgi:hypothetical protein